MEHSIIINDDRLPILIRRRKGSRRMILRYQPLQHALTLTLPRYVTVKQGLHFIEERRHWIAQQLREQLSPVPFTEGHVIPVQGTRYTLQHTGGRGVVRIENETILVPGDAHFMERRVREWLKVQARAEITRLAQEKAALIGQRLKRISLRDTSSRWGSCSHDGNLSFSWRLILAPPEVLDYLVCHEVAHLAEHNHSAAFWQVVRLLCPGYEKPERWLKRHGRELYAYG